MADTVREVTKAAYSVISQLASLTIGAQDSVEQTPVENSDMAPDTVSSGALNNATAPEESTALPKSNENTKSSEPACDQIKYGKYPSCEHTTSNDTRDATVRPPSQPSLSGNASAASQLQKPATPQLLPGLENENLHPKTAEIVRQVEWYFSDQNLVQDAHLLARTGPTGDGWVSLNEILGFKKMRQYKPKLKVKASVATSQLLEVQGKFIRRKSPLTVPLKVKPQLSAKRERDHILIEKPWMTKGMLQPSGFEEYATEGPITPAQFNEERRLFDPEEAFTTRIEYATSRFLNRKKMHQASAKVFSKFMFFGGWAANTHMFTGGISKQELEEYDQDQVLQMTAKMGIAECVIHGLDEYSEVAGSWVVDFEGIAKAFFSSEFFQRFDWSDEKVLHETTNVIRKFYEYLLYHDACPEYEDDIRDALDVCDLANDEIPKLAKFEAGIPGNFNTAASTLYGGFHAQTRPHDVTADWRVHGDPIGLSDKDAWAIFSAGILAHGTDEQVDDIHKAHEEKMDPKVTTEEDIGLEIVRVESISAEAKLIYEDDRIKGTFLKPTGKLHCKRWYHSGAAPRDLPPAILAEEKRKKGKKYEFVLEEHILQHCEKGMKLEANVSQLENGFMWLDLVTNVYPTFFKWTLNERMRDWKEPGPPKSWMQRVSGRDQTEEGQEQGEDGNE